MPRLVVPSLFLPRWRSISRSSSWWYGRIRWALPETRSFEQSTPRAWSPSISVSMTTGSTTTPLPMTGVMWSYSTPDGMSCSANDSPLTTRV